MLCGKRVRGRNTTSLAWDFIKNERWAPLMKLLRDPRSVVLYQQRRYLEASSSSATTTSTRIRAKLPMLSFAICLGAPVVILEAFLDCYPAALQLTDSAGRLPLHLACMLRSRSPSIIDLLLDTNNYKYYQDHSHVLLAVMMRDRQGNVPLHYAVQAACTSATGPDSGATVVVDDNHLDVLASLLSICPQCCVIPNNQSETPIALGIRLDCQIVTNMLVQTTRTLRVHYNNNWQHTSKFGEDATCPSSSHLGFEAASQTFSTNNNNNSSSVFLVDDSDMSFQLESWEGSERCQGVGERPRRRNAMYCVRP